MTVAIATPDKPANVPPLAESRARREAALARLAERQLAEHEGKFIDVAEARADMINAYAIVRTRLLGIPSRLAQRMPGVDRAVVTLVDDLVREGLEELAGGE